jgi:hypothetical protein
MMEVSKISANIRFSKDIGGSWKSLELAAEAEVTIVDDWTVCQAELYHQLTNPALDSF